MARLRHKETGAVATVPDDPGTIAVHEDAGWVVEAEPVQTNPALAPDQPETPAVKPRRGKTDPAAAGEDHTDPKES